MSDLAIQYFGARASSECSGAGCQIQSVIARTSHAQRVGVRGPGRDRGRTGECHCRWRARAVARRAG